MAAGDPQLFDRISGGPDPGRIEQDRHSLQHDLALQQVPGGSRQVRTIARSWRLSAIEQRALPTLGRPTRATRKPLRKASPRSPSATSSRSAHTGNSSCSRARPSNGADPFKIHPRLQLTELIEKSLLQGTNTTLDSTIHAGHIEPPADQSRHQIRDRFGPGEVQRPLSTALWLNSPGSARRTPGCSSTRDNTPCTAITPPWQ